MSTCKKENKRRASFSAGAGFGATGGDGALNNGAALELGVMAGKRLLSHSMLQGLFVSRTYKNQEIIL